MKTQLSFRTKLQLILLIVTLTSTFFLAMMAYQSHRALVGGKEAQLQRVVEGLIDKIDRNLFERYGDVQAYALSEPARSLDPEKLTEFINDMMVTYAPIYDLMMVTDTTGKVIAVSTKNKNGEEIKSEFLLGADFSSKVWFKKAISDTVKPGTSLVQDLYVDEDVAKITGGSGYVMNFTAPIRDKKTGKILGVWTNRMSWADVVQAISKEETDKIKGANITAAFPYIQNAQGVYLLHPQGDEVELQKNQSSNFAKKFQTGDTIQELNLETPYFSGRVLHATAKSKGYSSYPGNGWVTSLEIPATDAQMARNTQLILFAFSLIILANVIAFIIIRRMGQNFVSVVKRMATESSQVKAAANQISHSSNQLSSSTTEQAAAIQETAASMEEITAMLAQTTSNAGHCKQLSEEGQTEVQTGKDVVNKMSLAMEEISASNSKLDRLVGLIEDIKEKTKIINDIVTETRLLSFNASIEAARAGVHGKGFAVVAEEVGKLAAISGKAANEIHQLLDSSRQEVSRVVKDTQDRVSLGKNISQDCAVAFNTLEKSFEKVSDLIRTIANASKEQEVGINQTNRAMSEMDKVTHSNSRGAEVLAHEADRLYTGAESLNQSIGQIRLIVLGNDSTGLAPEDSPAKESKNTSRPIPNEENGKDKGEEKLVRSDSRWKGVA